MITVFGRATSSNVQVVMWAIGELGLAYERLDYGLQYGGTDTPAYLGMNPHGLVPTLKDGDLVIWESCAILRYLAAKYGGGGAFWPADPPARAKVDQWAEWGKVNFARDFTVPIFWARVRTAAVERDEAALTLALDRFDGCLGHLETQVGKHAYVAGEDFSLADIVIGHVLFRYFDIDIPRVDRPVVAAYYQRLLDRPAYRKHVTVSYEPLRVAGAH